MFVFLLIDNIFTIPFLAILDTKEGVISVFRCTLIFLVC